MQPGGQGLGPAVEPPGVQAEDRAQFVVGRDGAGGEVPVEQAHPDGRPRRGGQLDHRRVAAAALHPPSPGGQLGQQAPEPVGRGPQVPSGPRRHPDRGGRPQRAQDAEGLRPRHDRRVGGGERVRQADQQLREAAHGLLRPGQADAAPGAVGQRGGHRAVHGDAAERAEHRHRDAGHGAEHQRAPVAGAQVHHAAVGVGVLQHLAHGGGEQVVALAGGTVRRVPRRIGTAPRTADTIGARPGARRRGLTGRLRPSRVRRHALAHLFVVRRPTRGVKASSTADCQSDRMLS